MDLILTSIAPLLRAIPGSICGSISSKAPALLRLIHSLVQYDRTISIIASREEIVRIVIQCVASHRVSQNIVAVVMDIFSTLLNFNDGSVVLNNSMLIINCF